MAVKISLSEDEASKLYILLRSELKDGCDIPVELAGLSAQEY